VNQLSSRNQFQHVLLRATPCFLFFKVQKLCYRFLLFPLSFQHIETKNGALNHLSFPPQTQQRITPETVPVCTEKTEHKELSVSPHSTSSRSLLLLHLGTATAGKNPLFWILVSLLFSLCLSRVPAVCVSVKKRKVKK
jgi:hypothetical protein